MTSLQALDVCIMCTAGQWGILSSQQTIARLDIGDIAMYDTQVALDTIDNRSSPVQGLKVPLCFGLERQYDRPAYKARRGED